MLEPYVLKGTSTVLRGERDGDIPDLPDNPYFFAWSTEPDPAKDPSLEALYLESAGVDLFTGYTFEEEAGYQLQGGDSWFIQEASNSCYLTINDELIDRAIQSMMKGSASEERITLQNPRWYDYINSYVGTEYEDSFAEKTHKVMTDFFESKRLRPGQTYYFWAFRYGNNPNYRNSEYASLEQNGNRYFIGQVTIPDGKYAGRTSGGITLDKDGYAVTLESTRSKPAPLDTNIGTKPQSELFPYVYEEMVTKNSAVLYATGGILSEDLYPNNDRHPVYFLLSETEIPKPSYSDPRWQKSDFIEKSDTATGNKHSTLQVFGLKPNTYYYVWAYRYGGYGYANTDIVPLRFYEHPTEGIDYKGACYGFSTKPSPGYESLPTSQDWNTYYHPQDLPAINIVSSADNTLSFALSDASPDEGTGILKYKIGISPSDFKTNDNCLTYNGGTEKIENLTSETTYYLFAFEDAGQKNDTVYNASPYNVEKITISDGTINNKN